MKRIIAVLLLCVFLLCGCNSAAVGGEGETLELAEGEDRVDIEDGIFDDNNDENGFFIGSWLSYIELMPSNCGAGKENYEKYIGGIADNLKSVGVTDLFVQVRPFCDSIYPSEYSVSSSCVVKNQGDKLPFDYLSAIISVMKERNISVHGWINPFRVQSQLDESKLSDENIAKKWLKEKSDNVKKVGDSLYLSPSSAEVRKLIVDCVEELLLNYGISGIHIDDYFYPTDDEGFDRKEYLTYVNEGGQLSLKDWRTENINLLLSDIYRKVKSVSEDKIFSVSPSGDIAKNENELFADVKKWGNEEGYCDMIIPQLYYGFDNSSKPFEKTALDFRNMVSENVKICAGLALYKSGKEDTFALDGKTEWQENSDIIKRQTQFAKDNGYDGICLYSATFVNFNEISCFQEIQNLKDVIL